MMILVIDTETTGFDPVTAEVIELACASENLVGGGCYSDNGTWQGLIKPKGPIPPETSAVHHLTEKDFTEDKVFYNSLDKAWVSMLLWSGKPDAYVAHNAEFDRSFIARHGWGGSAPWLCTWRCALHLLPDAPGYGNQTLRYYLGLTPELPKGLAPHRALYDAVTTAAILEYFLKLKTLKELLELQHKPVLLKKVGFGKHKGELWRDIPKGYLTWILGQDFDADSVYTAKYYLGV